MLPEKDIHYIYKLKYWLLKQFTLPQNAKTYVNNVKDRSFALITHNIWNGVKSIDLKRWFKNFEGDLEEYFAACILDALIFRSEDQLVAQARELFTKKICFCPRFLAT